MIHWIDIETTGLNPHTDQIRQISVVTTQEDRIVRSLNLRVQFWGYYSLDPEFIEKFNVVRPDESFLSLEQAMNVFQDYFKKYPKIVLGGKNVAMFDYHWLKSWFPNKVQHRVWDIGNLFAEPEKLYTLEELLKKFLMQEYTLHDAYNDSLACAILYLMWRKTCLLT